MFRQCLHLDSRLWGQYGALGPSVQRPWTWVSGINSGFSGSSFNNRSPMVTGPSPFSRSDFLLESRVDVMGLQMRKHFARKRAQCNWLGNHLGKLCYMDGEGARLSKLGKSWLFARWVSGFLLCLNEAYISKSGPTSRLHGGAPALTTLSASNHATFFCHQVVSLRSVRNLFHMDVVTNTFGNVYWILTFCNILGMDVLDLGFSNYAIGNHDERWWSVTVINGTISLNSHFSNKLVKWLLFPLCRSHLPPIRTLALRQLTYLAGLLCKDYWVNVCEVL